MKKLLILSVFFISLLLVSCSMNVISGNNNSDKIAVRPSVIFEDDETQTAIDSVDLIVITVTYQADAQTFTISDTFDFHDHSGTLSSLIPVNVQFTLRIQGLDNSGAVIYHGEQLITGAASDTTVTIVASVVTPIPPEELKTQAIDSFSVLLRWKDNSSNETGFIIKRSENIDNAYIPIDTTAKDVVEITDNTNIKPLTVYYYKIMAYNSAGVSDSCVVKFDPLEFAPVPTKPVGETNIIVGSEYFFWTDSMTCGNGHALQYKFDWGDGHHSSWLYAPIASHAWSEAGTYIIKAKTRCTINNDVSSSWSEGLAITVENNRL